MKKLGASCAKIATFNLLGYLVSKTVTLGPGTEVVLFLLLASRRVLGFFYALAPFSGVCLKVEATDELRWDGFIILVHSVLSSLIF